MRNTYIPAYIRDKNRGLVLDLFLQNRELTRSEISRVTNISFPTVVKITDFFLEKGILAESDISLAAESGLGRKGQLLRLVPDAFSTVGIFFEGDYLNIGLFNLTNELMDSISYPFRGEPRNASDYEQISLNMTGAVSGFAASHPDTVILGIGIGLPCIVDSDTFMLYRQTNREGTSFYDLFTSFRGLSCPILLENDMNAAAYGEMILRRNPDDNTLLYMSLGTGLGAGLIIDSAIWHGMRNFAGEVGRTFVRIPEGAAGQDPEPFRLENQVNLNAIQERFGVDIRLGVPCSEETRTAISSYICSLLAPFIYNLAYTLDISRYVMAGAVVDYLGDSFFREMRKQLDNIGRMDLLQPENIIMPSISTSAGIAGAAALALENALPGLLS